MKPRADRQVRALAAAVVRGYGNRGVPPLVRAHPALAEAAVGLQEALDDLYSRRDASAWRAAGRLLNALASGEADFDGWQELYDEVQAAYHEADEGPSAAIPRLLLHLDDALDELAVLAETSTSTES